MAIDYNDPLSLHSDTQGVTHWSSRPQVSEITLVERVRAASIGAQPQEFGSPYWMFSATFSDLRIKEATEIRALIAKNKGLAPFLFYDRFCPFPLHVMGVPPQLRASVVKAVTLSGLSKENRTVTVTGTAGDVISVGDPFAFILNGKRHYNRALETLKLTGSAQALEVEKRPRLTFSGASISLERIRPCAAFAIDMQRYRPPTGGKLKEARIQGVEWTGASN